MGCANSAESFEDIIESKENELGFSLYSIADFQQALFGMNDHDKLNQDKWEKSLQFLHYTGQRRRSENKAMDLFLKGLTLNHSNPNHRSKHLSFQKVMIALYILSKDRTLDTARELYRLFDHECTNKLSNAAVLDIYASVVNHVVCYSLALIDYDRATYQNFKKLIDIEIQEFLEEVKRVYFEDESKTTVSEDEFIAKYQSLEQKLECPVLTSKGIRQQVMSFVFQDRTNVLEDGISVSPIPLLITSRSNVPKETSFLDDTPRKENKIIINPVEPTRKPIEPEMGNLSTGQEDGEGNSANQSPNVTPQDHSPKAQVK